MDEVRQDVGSCTFFSGGVLCSFSDPRTFRIVDGNNAWFFEWSDRFGPLRVGPRGETREQPGHRSSFWEVTGIWSAQGKRTEQAGEHLLAIWERPPVITHYWVRHGRQRVIVRSDEPEGSSAYSEEVFVEAHPTLPDQLPEAGITIGEEG